MTTVPLGVGAYKRLTAGTPEVRLENRFLEASPTNLREHAMLLSRSGTVDLAPFATHDPAALKGPRGTYSKPGLFGGDLFVVSGENFYRYQSDGTTIPVVGVITGEAHPNVAWMKGIGYEYMFISDGLLLQFYNGGTHATSTLTLGGGPITNQVVEIGGVYYSWDVNVDNNAPDGTAAHPWLALLSADPLTSLANLINFNGVRGVDFSTALGGPNPLFSALTDPTPPPAATMLVTSASVLAAGNFITTSVVSGAFLSWTGATLAGGNIHALQGVPVPDGLGIKALAAVSGFVLASVANSQKVFFILPGEVVIDPLNFFSKESAPDNVVDMVTVGDQVLICGDGSTENWYATGDTDAPFLPVEGRVYQRGAVAGTPCVVKDGVMFVGDDGIAYEVGYQSGGEADVGVKRISNHGIEERIRRMLRREQGLTP